MVAMPIQRKQLCSGCYRKIVPAGEKCGDCQQRGHRGTSKNRSGDPFYSSQRWRDLRAAKLLADPLCQCDDCVRTGDVVAADVVDHIKPRCDYPHLELEPTNLRSMSARHHNRHTARTRAR